MEEFFLKKMKIEKAKSWEEKKIQIKTPFDPKPNFKEEESEDSELFYLDSNRSDPLLGDK